MNMFEHILLFFTSIARDCKTLMMVVGLVWSNESRSYAGGNITTVRLVRDEDPD